MYSDYSLNITQRYFSLVWLTAGDVLTISISVNHFKNLHFCGILWAVMTSLMFAQFDLHSTNTNTFTQSFSIIWCSFHRSVFLFNHLNMDSTWKQPAVECGYRQNCTEHYKPWKYVCLYNIIHSSLRKTWAYLLVFVSVFPIVETLVNFCCYAYRRHSAGATRGYNHRRKPVQYTAFSSLTTNFMSATRNPNSKTGPSLFPLLAHTATSLLLGFSITPPQTVKLFYL